MSKSKKKKETKAVIAGQIALPESGADAQGEAAEKCALPPEKYTVTAQNTATLSSRD